MSQRGTALGLGVLLAGLLLVLLDVALGRWTTAPVVEGPDVAFARRVTQDLPGLTPRIVYDKDALGLRALTPVAAIKPAGLRRILCLGGSTTDQATQNTADTWCALLEQHLHQAPGTVQAMALGRSGARAADAAFWLRTRWDQLQPDLVITLLGINDLVWNGGPTYAYTGIEDRLAQLAAAQPPPPVHRWGWCLALSHLCRRLIAWRTQAALRQALRQGSAVEWHSATLPTLRERYQQLPLVTTLTRTPDPLDEFRDAVADIVTFLRQKQIPLLLLGQPVLWQAAMSPEARVSLWFAVQTPAGGVRPTPAWLAQEMARYNAVQATLARHGDAGYLGLDEVIPKTLAYYFDDCHVTDLGSRAMAEATVPVVRQMLAPSQPAAPLVSDTAAHAAR